MFPLIEFSWGSWLLWALVVTQLTIFSVTIYLHRCQAHRALDVHPALAHFFRAWLWLTTGMSTREWVAVHRKHHAHCETEQDPHSPQIQGLAKVFFLGVFLYSKAARETSTVQRYAVGAPNDFLEKTLYTKLSILGPTLLFIINMSVWGVAAGVAMSVVQLAWIPFWAAGFINGVGHYFGYRNFRVADASRNLVPWGLWIGGEELHNNHHAHPTSARLSYHRGELDIGWLAIKGLSALRLATVKKAIRPPKLGVPHSTVTQTWDAMVAYRLQVTRWYEQAWKQELSKLDLTAAVKKAVSKAGPFAESTAALKAEQLEQLRHFWAQLEALWSDRKSSKEEIMAKFKAWLAQAEASSVQSVRELAWKMARLA